MADACGLRDAPAPRAGGKPSCLRYDAKIRKLTNFHRCGASVDFIVQGERRRITEGDAIGFQGCNSKWVKGLRFIMEWRANGP